MAAPLLLVAVLLAFQTSSPIITRERDGSFAAMFVEKSTNVARLERLVRTPQADPDVRASRILSNLLQDIRVMAYARLGELGTPQALAALTRLDGEIVARRPTPPTVALGVWEHPAWHVGTGETEPLAHVDTQERRIALVRHWLLGGSDLFLITNRTPANPTTWARPRLAPMRWESDLQELSATLEGDGMLSVRIVSREDTNAPAAEPIVQRLDIAAIEQDSDGDGWTDLEEARLGLLPQDVDTDKDGIPDGDDACPNLAPGGETVRGDDADILRRALFAAFAVGGSRYLLLVEEGVPRVAIPGYGGPILFDVKQKEWTAAHGHGGVFVTWKILQRNADEAVVEIVDSGYFATLRIPLLAGRDFTDADVVGSPPVAIVGEAIARRLWPAKNAVGERLVVTGMELNGTSSTRALLVVGVAGDVKSSSLIDGLADSCVYLPLRQSDTPVLSLMTSQMTIMARSRGGQRLNAELGALVRRLDPSLAIATSETVEDSIALGLAPQRVLTTMAGSLGVVGWLLAAVGIYGVTAYSVARRSREFGIRLALGAPRRAVVGMVLRQGFLLTACGSVVGLVLAAGVSQILSVFLYGLRVLHLPTFAGAAILFVSVGLAACYIPARRAVGVGPVQMLRYE